MEEAKEQIRQMITLPLQHPKLFEGEIGDCLWLAGRSIQTLPLSPYAYII